MPCYRCDKRQTDPARGASPWKRGVVAGEQVLVCPDCQRAHDWTGDLDRCPACGSTQLARALGVTTCRGCGQTFDESSPQAPARPVERLADEVAAALDRVLRRSEG